MNTKLTPLTKLKLLIPVLYLLAAVLLFASLWPQQPEFYHYLGVIISLSSFTLWLVSRVQLGNAFSISPDAKFLVKSGVYSKLRHPVYYFSVLALAGIALFLWNAVAAGTVILLILLESYRIKEEEKLLIKIFGREYEEYQRSTWF